MLDGYSIFYDEDDKYFNIIKDEIQGGKLIMAYVEGEKGLYIQKLMDKSNDEFDKGDYEKSVSLLEEAWEELPSNKVIYDESYSLVIKRIWELG